MRSFLQICCILLTTIFLISCQKELGFSQDDNNNPGAGGSGGNIAGKWRVVHVDGLSHTVSEFSDFDMDIKMDILMSYIDEQPEGTFTFTGNKLNYNYGYAAQSQLQTKTWMDGVLVDDQEMEMEIEMPIQSKTESFSRIGADSLKFEKMDGLFPTTGGNMATLTNAKFGARYWFGNDTLYVRLGMTGDVTTSGIPGGNLSKVSASQVVSLVK